MSSQKPEAIVQKSRDLTTYPIRYIDPPCLALFSKHIPRITPPNSVHVSKIPQLLDCYLGLTGKRLSYISLNSKNGFDVIVGFYNALESGVLIALCDGTRLSYLRTLRLLIDCFGAEIDYLRGKELTNKGLTAEAILTGFDDVMIEYYSGWYVQTKSNETAFVRFQSLWWKYGRDRVRLLYNAAVHASARFREASNTLPMLNSFLDWFGAEDSFDGFHDSRQVSELMDSFCRYFFESQVTDERCLMTARKRWNDAREFFHQVMFESGVFASPLRGYPYIPPKRKAGKETHVKKSKNGYEVKVKLLTHIPLHIKDEQAMEILFGKIDSDIARVVGWAELQRTEIWNNYLKRTWDIKPEDFGGTSRKHMKRFGLKERQGDSIIAFSKSIGLPTTYSLEPFMYLLINEHPAITESFLIGLELFDKNGRRVGIETTDAGIYLVGFKLRSGEANSQQKILLNEKSKMLIEQVISITAVLRERLRNDSNDDHRFLFLTCGSAMDVPKKVNDLLTFRGKENPAVDARILQFKSQLKNKEINSEALAKLLTLTRFRASKGVQVYLDTRSVRAMAEALGHEKYKPDLIGHYLPEPILEFFQTRWVLQFQKAIICEALKDSKYLFRASRFKTIEELQEFLTNHSFQSKRINFENVMSDVGVDESSSVYISVNRESLGALMSLEIAVREAINDIDHRAAYLARLSRAVVQEIEKNDHDRRLAKCLVDAKARIEVERVRHLVYA